MFALFFFLYGKYYVTLSQYQRVETMKKIMELFSNLARTIQKKRVTRIFKKKKVYATNQKVLLGTEEQRFEAFMKRMLNDYFSLMKIGDEYTFVCKYIQNLANIVALCEKFGLELKYVEGRIKKFAKKPTVLLVDRVYFISFNTLYEQGLLNGTKYIHQYKKEVKSFIKDNLFKADDKMYLKFVNLISGERELFKEVVYDLGLTVVENGQIMYVTFDEYKKVVENLFVNFKVERV